MLKRNIEISREAAHLAVQHRQLLLKRDGQVVGSFPAEDLGVVVVDHPQSTYTHGALVELTQQDAVLVICGSNHLPCGLLLPMSDHTQVVTRLRQQIELKLPVKKRLWQQLVQAKILAQARNLQPRSTTATQLRHYARAVRSNDADNREGVAARAYWSAWLMEAPEAAADLAGFRRDPDATGLNAMLNYGYAIVRAAIARAITSAGLHPALGLHHSNRSNAFCLADDLIEPLRPMVDETVRERAFAGERELTQHVKAELLNVLTEEVTTGDSSGPLSVALHRYVGSLVAVIEEDADALTIPVPCNSAVTAACG